MNKMKLLPHLLGIIGGVLFFFGAILDYQVGNQIVFRIMVVVGFLMVGCSGLIIIMRRQYSFGFFEVKGILSVIYGSIILFVGLAGAIFFGIFMFR